MIVDIYPNFSKTGKSFHLQFLGKTRKKGQLPTQLFSQIPNHKILNMLDEAVKHAKAMKELKKTPRASSSFSNTVKKCPKIDTETLHTPGVGRYEPKLIQKNLRGYVDYGASKTEGRTRSVEKPYCCAFDNECSFDIRKALREIVDLREESVDYQRRQAHEKLSGFILKRKISVKSVKEEDLSPGKKAYFEETSLGGSPDSKKQHSYVASMNQKKRVLRRVLNGSSYNLAMEEESKAEMSLKEKEKVNFSSLASGEQSIKNEEESEEKGEISHFYITENAKTEEIEKELSLPPIKNNSKRKKTINLRKMSGKNEEFGSGQKSREEIQETLDLLILKPNRNHVS